MDDTDVINFLLTTEIIPLCLRTMELGSELSKTVATFIVQKILLDDVRPSTGAHMQSPMQINTGATPACLVQQLHVCFARQQCRDRNADLPSKSR